MPLNTPHIWTILKDEYENQGIDDMVSRCTEMWNRSHSLTASMEQQMEAQKPSYDTVREYCAGSMDSEPPIAPSPHYS